MKRAAALALALLLVAAGVVAADTFPLPGFAHARVGVGWRLMAELHDRSGAMAFRVRTAGDEASYAALWHELGPAATRNALIGPQRPAVNFDSEIVAVFGEGISSCTTGVRLDDVVIDRAARTVHSEMTENRTCLHLDLTGSIVFVVALSREALPESPYTIQLHARPTCRSCTEHEDRVTL